MEINYELLEDYYIKFNLYHLRESNPYKREIKKYLKEGENKFLFGKKH